MDSEMTNSVCVFFSLRFLLLFDLYTIGSDYRLLFTGPVGVGLALEITNSDQEIYI